MEGHTTAQQQDARGLAETEQDSSPRVRLPLSLRSSLSRTAAALLAVVLLVLLCSWAAVLVHYLNSHAAHIQPDSVVLSDARTESADITSKVAAAALPAPTTPPCPTNSAPVVGGSVPPCSFAAWPAAPTQNPYAHCRPGTQRCIAFSTATPYSRFPIMDHAAEWDSNDAEVKTAVEAAIKHAAKTAAAPLTPGTSAPNQLPLAPSPLPADLSALRRLPALLSSSAEAADAQSHRPYDIDGTSELRKRLRAYIKQAQESCDFDAAVERIDATVAKEGIAPELQAQRKWSLWQAWIGSQRYTLHVDGESGLGNKLLPIISAFGFSLLTKRTLLLFFPVPGFEDLFTVGPTPPTAEEQAAANASGHPLPVFRSVPSSWPRFLADLVRITRRLDPEYASAPNKDAHWTHQIETRMNDRTKQGKPCIKNFADILALLPKTITGPPAVEGVAASSTLYTSIQLDLQSPDASRTQSRMLCDAWVSAEAYTNSWLVHTWSDQYWMPLLVGNEHTRPTMLSWLNENNMYGPLARFFLNWDTTLVRARADEFARKHFSRYNIGIQLRRKERLALRKSEVAAAIDGAKQLAMLYQMESDEMELTPTADRRAELMRDPKNGGPLNSSGMRLRAQAPGVGSDGSPLPPKRPSVTFFLATDDFNSRERLAQLLAPFGHVAFSPSDSYPRHEEQQGAGYYMPLANEMPDGGGGGGAHSRVIDSLPPRFRDGLTWAITENLLLSSCDDIIISPSSTYGYHAAAYSSLIPHRVLYDPVSQVLRQLTSEPHSHFWKPLFREVSEKEVCRSERDLPAQLGQDECCPRWGNGEDTFQ